jgi:hypothetical protein
MKTYIMVWVESEEKWYYLKESFKKELFKEDCYSIELWK